MGYTKSADTRTLCRSAKITVLGIGNVLLKDEGAGVHLARQLAGIVKDANVSILDVGTYPDFASLVDDHVDKLIILDAIKGGHEPGTIYRFTADDTDLDSAVPISSHDIGVRESLRMMLLLNKQPKSTVIIGIEPKTIDFGLDLSPEVEKELPQMIELILKEIEETTATEVEK